MSIVERLLRRAIARLGLVNLLAILFLCLAQASLVHGLQRATTGLPGAPLLVLAGLGVLAGWWLAGRHINGWAAAGWLLFTGLFLNLLATARLARPLAALLTVVWDWLGQAARLAFLERASLAGLDPSALLQAAQGLALSSQTILERLTAWLAALLNRSPLYDPLVVLLVWGLLVWCLSAWAAWWMRRSSQPLAGLAPGGMALALNLAASAVPVESLIVWLGALLALQGLAGYARRLRVWLAHGYDLADIQVDWGFAIAALALVLMSLAWGLPSLSLESISTRLQPAAQGPGQLNQAFGLRAPVKPAPTALDLARSPGLPNLHLVGSGLELSQRPVFWATLETSLQPAAPAASPPSLYWRSLTYDRYTGRGWSTAPFKLESIPPNRQLESRLARLDAANFLELQISFRTIQPGGLLFVSGELLSADQPIQAAWRSPGDLFGAQVQAAGYRVAARLPSPSAAQLRAAGRAYPAWVEQTYLQLPRSLPLRVWELALDLTSTQPTPYDQALAIQGYLRRFSYTLDLDRPPAGRDLVDYFLFDLQRGYCDYYASAMVVLARAAGLPARLVQGYAAGRSLDERQYLVTEADAHAWVEVFFPGYGWVEFEPTPSLPAIQRPSQDTLAGLPPAVPSPLVGSGLARTALLWLTALLGGALAFLALWRLFDVWRLGRLAPPLALRAVYSRLYRQARQGSDAPLTGLTPDEVAARLSQRLDSLLPPEQAARLRQDQPFQRIAGLYGQVMYSPQPASPAGRQQAVQAWRLARWAFGLGRLAALRRAFNVLFHRPDRR